MQEYQVNVDEPKIMNSPPPNDQKGGDDKISLRLRQMREEYERIKEEVHQSIANNNAIMIGCEENESRLLLNLSLPSGGEYKHNL